MSGIKRFIPTPLVKVTIIVEDRTDKVTIEAEVAYEPEFSVDMIHSELNLHDLIRIQEEASSATGEFTFKMDRGLEGYFYKTTREKKEIQPSSERG